MERTSPIATPAKQPLLPRGFETSFCLASRPLITHAVNGLDVGAPPSDSILLRIRLMGGCQGVFVHKLSSISHSFSKSCPRNQHAARLHPWGFIALRAQGATSACGLLAMTNLRTSRHRMCRKDCQPAWRSLSAATDAIGAYRFNGGRYGLHVQRRARLSLPYIARPKACVLFILQYSFSTCPCFFPCRFTDSRHSAACLPGRRAGFPR